MALNLGLVSDCPAAMGFFEDEPAGGCANARLVAKSMGARSREDCFMSIFLYSSEQSFYILCSYSGFRQSPWRRSFKERDGETNQGGGDCRSDAAVRQARG